jgi:hypothetical protein
MESNGEHYQCHARDVTHGFEYWNWMSLASSTLSSSVRMRAGDLAVVARALGPEPTVRGAASSREPPGTEAARCQKSSNRANSEHNNKTRQ